MSFFDRFQITVLILLYLVCIGRMLQLRVRGTNPLVLGIGKKGLPGILEILFGIGLVIWTLEVFVHSLNLRFHVIPPVLCAQLFAVLPLKILGTVLITIGFLVFVLSLVSFGSSWRIGIDKRNPGKLVTTGIFSITRNPIFIFLDMYFLGTWLIDPTPFFGIVAILTIIGVHWQILQEEEYLKEQYGSEYEDYVRDAGRYFHFGKSLIRFRVYLGQIRRVTHDS